MIKKTVEYIKIPKKIFFPILALVIIGALIKFLKPQVQLVDTGTITQGKFQKVIIDEGITEFKEKQILTAPADGITPKLALKEGDPVKKDQVLFQFKWDILFEVKAPFDGFILKVFEKDERHVARGTPIIEIGNNKEIFVTSELLSEEVVSVAEGQKVTISKWGGAQKLMAKVVKVEKSANEVVSALGVKEQRVKVHMEILTKKEIWKNLGDGYKVEVTIITDLKEDALLLPVGAIFSHENNPSIYIIEDKKIKLMNVEVGDKNQDFIHLKTKLPPKTQVVIYPGGNLSDGDKIKIRE